MKNKISTLKYEIGVFFLFVLSRVPSLGHDIFNTDVWKWKTRTFNFGSGVFGLNFEETIQRYHPGVVLMWIGTAGVKIYNIYYEVFYGHSPPDNDISVVFGLHTTQKTLVVVVIGFTVASIFYVLRKEFSLKYASIFVLLLIFEPFYAALTRVFHLEGLMSTFMLASFVWFYSYLQNSKKNHLLFSAFFGAFAFLTKTSSLYLLPFSGLLIVLHYYKEDKNLLKSVTKSINPYLIWLGACVAFFVLFWPVMWVAPFKAIQTLFSGIFETGIEEGHEQIYFGNFVQDPGVSFYIVVFLFRSSVYLLLGLVAYTLTYKKFASQKTRTFSLYVILFAVLYAVEMTIPSKKLDRYLIPTIISLLLVAAFFYEWLLDLAVKKFKFVKNYVFALSLLFAPALICALFIHPDYFSYYNPLFGGLRTGLNVIEPKWMIGQQEVVDFFVDIKKSENVEEFSPDESLDSLIDKIEIRNKLTIGFPEKYYTQIYPFIHEIGGRATIKDITGQAVNTKYFVYPVWEDDSHDENRFSLEYVGSIKLRGVEIYRVYERNDR